MIVSLPVPQSSSHAVLAGIFRGLRTNYGEIRVSDRNVRGFRTEILILAKVFLGLDVVSTRSAKWIGVYAWLLVHCLATLLPQQNCTMTVSISWPGCRFKPFRQYLVDLSMCEASSTDIPVF